MSQAAFLSNLNRWIRDYSAPGVPDQRAIENFIECETSEAVRSLSNELRAIAAGKLDNMDLDHSIGMNRKFRHGTYQEWAKTMLLWISGYKR